MSPTIGNHAKWTTVIGGVTLSNVFPRVPLAFCLGLGLPCLASDGPSLARRPKTIIAGREARSYPNCRESPEQNATAEIVSALQALRKFLLQSPVAFATG